MIWSHETFFVNLLNTYNLHFKEWKKKPWLYFPYWLQDCGYSIKLWLWNQIFITFIFIYPQLIKVNTCFVSGFSYFLTSSFEIFVLNTKDLWKTNKIECLQRLHQSRTYYSDHSLYLRLVTWSAMEICRSDWILGIIWIITTVWSIVFVLCSDHCWSPGLSRLAGGWWRVWLGLVVRGHQCPFVILETHQMTLSGLASRLLEDWQHYEW